jgi:hypothetical protein
MTPLEPDAYQGLAILCIILALLWAPLVAISE